MLKIIDSFIVYYKIQYLTNLIRWDADTFK